VQGACVAVLLGLLGFGALSRTQLSGRGTHYGTVALFYLVAITGGVVCLIWFLVTLARFRNAVRAAAYRGNRG
jgi:hypothetical protein